MIPKDLQTLSDDELNDWRGLCTGDFMLRQVDEEEHFREVHVLPEAEFEALEQALIDEEERRHQADVTAAIAETVAQDVSNPPKESDRERMFKSAACRLVTLLRLNAPEAILASSFEALTKYAPVVPAHVLAAKE